MIPYPKAQAWCTWVSFSKNRKVRLSHSPRLITRDKQMGLIAMSERDLQRIEVLSKVAAGRMTMVTAAHLLDIGIGVDAATGANLDHTPNPATIVLEPTGKASAPPKKLGPSRVQRAAPIS